MISRALYCRRHVATATSVLLVSLMLAPAAHASGSSMPWEAPLQSILESIEGPVAKIVAGACGLPRPPQHSCGAMCGCAAN